MINDEYLIFGFYVRGVHRVLTARQMRSRKVIRWIKNEMALRNIPFRQWQKFLDDYLRDAPIIFKRRRWSKRDQRWVWVEARLPSVRALECEPHWFEDFGRAVPMDELPRLPRKNVRLRVWTIGCILRAMKNQK